MSNAVCQTDVLNRPPGSKRATGTLKDKPFITRVFFRSSFNNGCSGGTPVEVYLACNVVGRHLLVAADVMMSLAGDVRMDAPPAETVDDDI